MISVSCPGKIMLAGEYAVLDGGRALAHTIDARMRVTFDMSPSGETTIHSNLWPKAITYPSSSEELALQSIAFFESQLGKLPTLQIKIESELEVQHGVGSSSALRLCLVTGLAQLMHKELKQQDFMKMAFQDQKRFQTLASGYDIITQALGGLVCVSFSDLAWPSTCFKASSPHLEKVKIYVGGKGAPTKPTAISTAKWLNQNVKKEDLLEKSEDLVEAWFDSNIVNLLKKIELHRELFKESPSFPASLEMALSPFQDRSRWTWKTTGAGGEDAILLIGDPPKEAVQSLNQLGWYPSKYQFSEFGLSYDHSS
jgi:mevalonate kinase